MTIVLRDQANVNSESLTVAKRIVSRVMTAAGFTLTWIDTEDVLNADFALRDPSHVIKLPNSGFIAVVITPRALPGSSSTEAGFAAVTTGPYRRAYVFYDCVKAFADLVEVARHNGDVGIVLGHVILHELGHLLIPGEAHTPVGVMRPLWDRNQWKEAAAGRLLFGRGQSELMRNQIKDRCAASLSGRRAHARIAQTTGTGDT